MWLQGARQGESSCKAFPLDFFNDSVVRKNYTALIARAKKPEPLPSQADALVDFLEAKLEQIKTPVLRRALVRNRFTKLKLLLRRDVLRNKGMKRAHIIASQLNMTLLGYGRLADAEYHIEQIKKHIAELRLQTGKVPIEYKRKIEDHYQLIFRGHIRDDLVSLVHEYLKRVCPAPAV